MRGYVVVETDGHGWEVDDLCKAFMFVEDRDVDGLSDQYGKGNLCLVAAGGIDGDGGTAMLSDDIPDGSDQVSQSLSPEPRRIGILQAFHHFEIDFGQIEIRPAFKIFFEENTGVVS